MLTSPLIPNGTSLSHSGNQIGRDLPELSLKLIWEQVLKRLPKETTPPLLEAKEIRSWLNNPKNHQTIESVDFLDLSELNLSILPPELGLFTSLKTLDLSGNQIGELDSLIPLLQLECLFLNNTKIKNISALTQLTQLVYLYFEDNEFPNLPDLSNLTRLRHLFLKSNQITDLSSLEKLNLTTLDLSENRLLGDFNLDPFSSVKFLHLNNNRIEKLVISKDLPEIADLYLTGNALEDLSFLQYCPNLERLYADCNPITLTHPVQELLHLTWLSLKQTLITDFSFVQFLPENCTSDFSDFQDLGMRV